MFIIRHQSGNCLTLNPHPFEGEAAHIWTYFHSGTERFPTQERAAAAIATYGLKADRVTIEPLSEAEAKYYGTANKRDKLEAPRMPYTATTSWAHPVIGWLAAGGLSAFLAHQGDYGSAAIVYCGFTAICHFERKFHDIQQRLYNIGGKTAPERL